MNTMAWTKRETQQETKIREIMKVLEENPRAKFTEISEVLELPVSTVFDYLCKIQRKYVLKAYWSAKSEMEDN